MTVKLVRGRPIVAGSAEGALMVSDEPLSFWGGYDPRTGEIIDRRHSLSGRNAAGHVLVLPSTRGSSTSTAILLEAIRAGTAPAAIVSTAADPFLALASVVGEELFGTVLPIAVIPRGALDALRKATTASVSIDGTIRIG